MRRRLSAGTAAVGLLAGLGAVAAPGAAVAAEEPVVLLSEDFEDGDLAPLVQNGGATLSVVDADGDKALRVTGRTNDYDGVKTPAGLLQPGGQYTFSMQVKLAAGTPATSVRFVVEPAYTWVGNTAVSADAWTTVTGTYTAPAGGSAEALLAYIGTKDLGAAYDYLVDDLVITGRASGVAPRASGGSAWWPAPAAAGGAAGPPSGAARCGRSARGRA